MSDKKDKISRRDLLTTAIAGSVGAMLPRTVAFAQSPPAVPSNLRLSGDSNSLPSEPRDFHVVSGNASSVTLAWQPPVTGVSPSYSIERFAGSGWTSVASGLVVTSYRDTELSASSTYSWRVRAVTSGGTGPYSGAVSFSVPAAGDIILDSFSRPTIRNAAGQTTPLWNPAWGDAPFVQNGVCVVPNGPLQTGTSTGGNTSTTLVDTNAELKSLNFGPTGMGGVAILAGTGAGQVRQVSSNTSTVITVAKPWETIPDATSHYATYVPVAGELYFLPYQYASGYPWPNGYLQSNLEFGTFDPTVDRFSFRAKSVVTCIHPVPENTGQFGTYVKKHNDPDSRFQGDHYYHYWGGNWYADQWGMCILNRKPHHRVGVPNLDWVSDPEFQQGYSAYAARISNSTATKGSVTVIPVWPEEAANATYFYVGLKLLARPRSQGYVTPGVFPDGAHPVYTVASVATGGTSFTLDRPFEGATGNWTFDNVLKFPSNLSDGSPGQPMHYFEGLTNFYVRTDNPKPWSDASSLVLWNAKYFYYDDFKLWKSNGYEPDNLVWTIWCIYTGTAYEIQWNGPKFTAESYTVYYGSAPLANPDGTYNGQGTTGGRGILGPSAGIQLWTSPTMAEQQTIYFFIKPTSSPTGTHFAMTKKM